MLSLLTYGATFGVAERASTRHEFDGAERLNRPNSIQSTASQSIAIDPKISSLDRLEKTGLGKNKLEKINLGIDLETEPEQPAPKGGVIGRLKRLIQRWT